MRLEQGEKANLRSKLVDDRGSTYVAPKLVIKAVATLLGGAELIAVSAMRSIRQAREGTQWNVVALTDSHLIYVVAVHPSDLDWDLGANSDEPASVSAQRWAVGDIGRVHLDVVEDFGSEFDSDWVWAANVALTMKDGTEVEFVPTDEYLSRSTGAVIEKFVRHLSPSAE